jgi:hypothetical protein
MFEQAPKGLFYPFIVKAHSYANGHADWTLDETENKAGVLVVTLADQAANIIADGSMDGRKFWLRNVSGAAITLKVSGGTGIAVANGKTALLMYLASAGDYVRLTADQTH